MRISNFFKGVGFVIFNNIMYLMFGISFILIFFSASFEMLWGFDTRPGLILLGAFSFALVLYCGGAVQRFTSGESRFKELLANIFNPKMTFWINGVHYDLYQSGDIINIERAKNRGVATTVLLFFRNLFFTPFVLVIFVVELGLGIVSKNHNTKYNEILNIIKKDIKPVSLGIILGLFFLSIALSSISIGLSAKMMKAYSLENNVVVKLEEMVIEEESINLLFNIDVKTEDVKKIDFTIKLEDSNGNYVENPFTLSLMGPSDSYSLNEKKEFQFFFHRIDRAWKTNMESYSQLDKDSVKIYIGFEDIKYDKVEFKYKTPVIVNIT